MFGSVTAGLLREAVSLVSMTKSIPLLNVYACWFYLMGINQISKFGRIFCEMPSFSSLFIIIVRTL